MKGLLSTGPTLSSFGLNIILTTLQCSAVDCCLLQSLVPSPLPLAMVRALVVARTDFFLQF